MPHGSKVRGKRGKRTNKPTHVPSRPIQQVIHRLGRSAALGTELNRTACLPSQAEDSAGALGAAALPADAGETCRGSDSELLQYTTPAGVVYVSVDSDSDNPSTGDPVPSSSHRIEHDPNLGPNCPCAWCAHWNTEPITDPSTEENPTEKIQ